MISFDQCMVADGRQKSTKSCEFRGPAGRRVVTAIENPRPSCGAQGQCQSYCGLRFLNYVPVRPPAGPGKSGLYTAGPRRCNKIPYADRHDRRWQYHRNHTLYTQRRSTSGFLTSCTYTCFLTSFACASAHTLPRPPPRTVPRTPSVASSTHASAPFPGRPALPGAARDRRRPAAGPMRIAGTLPR